MDRSTPVCLPEPQLLTDSTQAQDTRWLWQGYLAPGQTTLLTSQWKSGKTTLLAVLLDRLREGGSLAGLPIRPGKALVITEEDPDQWRRRGSKFHLQPHVYFNCRPFQGRRPTFEQWLVLLQQLRYYRDKHGIDLAVLDTLAPLLPGRCENHAALLLEALAPLNELTASGLAILLLHHCRKAAGPDGHASRGTGALTGFVDILIEMHWYGRAAELDRRRKLIAFSRHDETPRQLIIELNADGTDYLAHGDFEQDQYSHQLQTLLSVLEAARVKLSREEVLAAWPKEEPKPAPKTLWRWLERAVEQGLVRRDGEGVAHNAFRYWVPSLEKLWETDFMAKLQQDMQDEQRRGGLEGLFGRRAGK